MPAASSPSVTEPPEGRAWRAARFGERSPADSGTASLTRHGHWGQAARRPAQLGDRVPPGTGTRCPGADVRGWTTGSRRRARLPGGRLLIQAPAPTFLAALAGPHPPGKLALVNEP